MTVQPIDLANVEQLRDMLKREAHHENDDEVSTWLRSDAVVDLAYRQLKILIGDLNVQLAEFNERYDAGDETQSIDWRNRTVVLMKRLVGLNDEIEPLAKDWRRRTHSVTVDSSGYARRFGKLGKAIAKHRRRVLAAGYEPTVEDEELWAEYDRISEEHQRARSGT